MCVVQINDGGSGSDSDDEHALQFFTLQPGQGADGVPASKRGFAGKTTGWGSMQQVVKTTLQPFGDEGHGSGGKGAGRMSSASNVRSPKALISGGLGLAVLVAGLVAVVYAASGLNPRANDVASLVSIPASLTGLGLVIGGLIVCRLAHAGRGNTAMVLVIIVMVVEAGAVGALGSVGGEAGYAVAVVTTHFLALIALLVAFYTSLAGSMKRRGLHRALSEDHFVIPSHAKRDRIRMEEIRNAAATFIQKLEYVPVVACGSPPRNVLTPLALLQVPPQGHRASEAHGGAQRLPWPVARACHFHRVGLPRVRLVRWDVGRCRAPVRFQVHPGPAFSVGHDVHLIAGSGGCGDRASAHPRALFLVRRSPHDLLVRAVCFATARVHLCSYPCPTRPARARPARKLAKLGNHMVTAKDKYAVK